MRAAQVSLSNYSDVVCKICSHLTKLEQQNFCKYFDAFLDDSTLSLVCDFLEAKK